MVWAQTIVPVSDTLVDDRIVEMQETITENGEEDGKLFRYWPYSFDCA